MSRRNKRHARNLRKEPASPLSAYLTALEASYPAARGQARVVTRQDNRIVVSVPLPARAEERMRLFDRMAEVGTKLLLETDQYIILSAQ